MFHPRDKLYFQVLFNGIFLRMFPELLHPDRRTPPLCSFTLPFFIVNTVHTVSPLAPCSTRPWTPDGWHCLAVCLLAQMFIASSCLWPMLTL